MHEFETTVPLRALRHAFSDGREFSIRVLNAYFGYDEVSGYGDAIVAAHHEYRATVNLNAPHAESIAFHHEFRLDQAVAAYMLLRLTSALARKTKETAGQAYYFASEKDAQVMQDCLFLAVQEQEMRFHADQVLRETALDMWEQPTANPYHLFREAWQRHQHAATDEFSLERWHPDQTRAAREFPSRSQEILLGLLFQKAENYFHYLDPQPVPFSSFMGAFSKFEEARTWFMTSLTPHAMPHMGEGNPYAQLMLQLHEQLQEVPLTELLPLYQKTRFFTQDLSDTLHQNARQRLSVV